MWKRERDCMGLDACVLHWHVLYVVAGHQHLSFVMQCVAFPIFQITAHKCWTFCTRIVVSIIKLYVLARDCDCSQINSPALHWKMSRSTAGRPPFGRPLPARTHATLSQTIGMMCASNVTMSSTKRAEICCAISVSNYCVIVLPSTVLCNKKRTIGSRPDRWPVSN